jgi:hypothetical protein
MHTLSTKLETKPIEKEAGICTWPKTVKTSESPIENHSLLIPKLWLIPVTSSNCTHRKKNRRYVGSCTMHWSDLDLQYQDLDPTRPWPFSKREYIRKVRIWIHLCKTQHSPHNNGPEEDCTEGNILQVAVINSNAHKRCHCCYQFYPPQKLWAKA